MRDTLEANRMLSSLTEEAYGNALSYIRFLFERDMSGENTVNNEAAMMKIQSLIGGNRGWSSEQEMIKDMAKFRRERSF